MCTLACSARRKDGHAGPAGLLYSLQGVMLRHRLLTGREGSWPISVLYASQRPAEVEAVQGKYSSISHKTRLVSRAGSPRGSSSHLALGAPAIL